MLDNINLRVATAYLGSFFITAMLMVAMTSV